MLKKFFAWLEAREHNRRIHEAARFWAKQGSPTPYAEAAHEMSLRMQLEEFRNFASARYLEDPKLTRDDIKAEWIEKKISPLLRIEFCREEAKLLIGAIQAMGDEMFHTTARRARAIEIELAFDEACSKTVGIQMGQRERGMRIGNVQ